MRGIGRWTAQMFLMFRLGRLDVLAPDDLGLQGDEATRRPRRAPATEGARGPRRGLGAPALRGLLGPLAPDGGAAGLSAGPPSRRAGASTRRSARCGPRLPRRDCASCAGARRRRSPIRSSGDAAAAGHIDALEAQLAGYFSGELRAFDLSLDPVGTPFQLDVWRALQDVPHGRTVTYGQQAARIGRPSAVRAVAAANGRNPLNIVVPCHRVVGADGTLTGYAGGLEAKRWLLDLERAQAALLSRCGFELLVHAEELVRGGALAIDPPPRGRSHREMDRRDGEARWGWNRTAGFGSPRDPRLLAVAMASMPEVAVARAMAARRGPGRRPAAKNAARRPDGTPRGRRADHRPSAGGSRGEDGQQEGGCPRGDPDRAERTGPRRRRVGARAPGTGGCPGAPGAAGRPPSSSSGSRHGTRRFARASSADGAGLSDGATAPRNMDRAA